MQEIIRLKEELKRVHNFEADFICSTRLQNIIDHCKFGYHDTAFYNSFSNFTIYYPVSGLSNHSIFLSGKDLFYINMHKLHTNTMYFIRCTSYNLPKDNFNDVLLFFDTNNEQIYYDRVKRLADLKCFL